VRVNYKARVYQIHCRVRRVSRKWYKSHRCWQDKISWERSCGGEGRHRSWRKGEDWSVEWATFRMVC
jgi:hypothetical protein